MISRYTAALYCNDQLIAKSYGNDFSYLMVKLLTGLERENSSASGKIIDNLTGKVIHRCRKTCFE